MYRTPIKSKNPNKTSMVKAMKPFRDSQTPLIGSPDPGSMYRLNPPLIGPACKYVSHEEVKSTIFNSQL